MPVVERGSGVYVCVIWPVQEVLLVVVVVRQWVDHVRVVNRARTIRTIMSVGLGVVLVRCDIREVVMVYLP